VSREEERMESGERTVQNVKCKIKTGKVTSEEGRVTSSEWKESRLMEY
jgi:hypothetical protein